MVDFKDLADKAKGLIGSNKDKIDQAVDKAGDVLDEKTGGKFAAVVDKVQDAAKSAVDKAAAGEAGAQDKAEGDVS